MKKCQFFYDLMMEQIYIDIDILKRNLINGIYIFLLCHEKRIVRKVADGV